MYAPIAAPGRDDVASGPVLHAVNRRVKARRGPAARAVVLPQDNIHDVGLAVEQVVEARAEEDARGAVVPGCTARGAMARARRHVAGLWCRGAGGSFLRCLRRVPGRRGPGGVPPPSLRCAPTDAALRGPPLKAWSAGERRTALSALGVALHRGPLCGGGWWPSWWA